MSPAPALRVGLVGLGTVGQGLVRLLEQNGAAIGARAGRTIRVVAATARDLAKPRAVDLAGIRLLPTPEAVIQDPEVDVVVELIGGTTTARDVVLRALEAGKPVVTANKALLAEYGNEVFAAASAAGVSVGFEAAVAGGIPVIKAIREGLSGNRITRVAGIINGTCNYILTQMTTKGQGFEAALAEAQRLGYAEADPSFDVDGIDAAHKLTLLASIAFGMPLSFSALSIAGIRSVTAEDIRIAQALGYRIKHLGIATQDAAGVELRLHATLIPEEHLLAKVDGVLNAVLLHGDASGPITLVGAGAGGAATASAVAADLVDLARAGGRLTAVPGLGFSPEAIEALPVRGIAETVSAFYLRLRVADEPGVLKAITGILAELDISIEAIQQREPGEDEDATVALITSATHEGALRTALARIEALPFVREKAQHLRVEHFD